MSHPEATQQRSSQHNDGRILVKRKRDEDPVVALVFENKRRRGGDRAGHFYYKFSQTGVESAMVESAAEQTYLEAVTSGGQGPHTYISSRKSKPANVGTSGISDVHAELEQMALQYLKLEGAEETHEQEYVWDVYLKEQLPGEREIGGVVGYILDEADGEGRELGDDSSVSDADDSNAEDYYANDYPDEIDDEEQDSGSWLGSNEGDEGDAD